MKGRKTAKNTEICYVSHNGIDYCKTTMGVDNLIKNYQKSKQRVIMMMYNNPNLLVNTIWEANTPLAMDHECQWHVGNTSRRTNYSCSQCKNLKRLVCDTSIPIIDQTITIKCGNHKGEVWKVKQHNETKTAHFLHQQGGYVSFYKRQCDAHPVTYTDIIEGDIFTISTLISWGIQDLFFQDDLPHIDAPKTVFVCNHIGYSVSEVPTFENLFRLAEKEKYIIPKLNVFKKSIFISILAQILIFIKHLTKINGVHGNPSLDALKFTKEKTKYIYEGISTDFPITLKVSNWTKGSLIVSEKIYTTNKFLMIDNTKWIKNIKTSRQGGINVYRMNETNGHNHYNQLYGGSNDLYGFILACMTNKTFYNSMYYYGVTKQWWEALWTKETKETIELTLEEFHNNINPSNKEEACQKFPIVETLKGLWLKCDVVNQLFDILSE
jgi:hypothetical protein